MRNIFIFVLIIIIVYLYIKSGNKENFESDSSINLRTSDGKYLMVCSDKSLCITDNPDNRATFKVMKFSETVIGLSYDGRYVSACFGDKCSDDIMVNNYNPYAANTKLTLIKDMGKSYKITFYDGKYMNVGLNGNITKTTDIKKALDIFMLE